VDRPSAAPGNLYAATDRPIRDRTFSDACAYLKISSQDLAALRAAGLAVCAARGRRQVYPGEALRLTGWLLGISEAQGWKHATITWYADLLFAASIGQTVLLPAPGGEQSSDDAAAPSTAGDLPASWLETPLASALARYATAMPAALDPHVVPILQSLLAATVGKDLFWRDEQAVRNSPVGPVLQAYEAQGHPLLFRPGHAPPSGNQPFALLVLAFATLAPPITPELRQIVQTAYGRMRGFLSDDIPLEEQERIRREQLVAVDRLYAAKATEIHSPSDGVPEVRFGTLILPKRTITLQLPLNLDSQRSNPTALDNILDIVRPFLGPYGARVVQALYEIANDPPNWRQPIITVDTNALLDRLGEKRDDRGIHYSRNRARLRDTLNAAHNLEVVGEYTTTEEGLTLRHAVRRSVLSLIGATFEAGQTAGLTSEELFLQGLPRSVQVRLNFYDGVRRPDGTLGSQYLLLPRLAEPKVLVKANYARTFERLRQYLLYRYRQETGKTLTLTRREALEAGGVTNKNVTRATHTMNTALNRLVVEGILESHSPVPLDPEGTFLLIYGNQVTTAR
jgi:hypothetical protein